MNPAPDLRTTIDAARSLLDGLTTAQLALDHVLQDDLDRAVAALDAACARLADRVAGALAAAAGSYAAFHRRVREAVDASCADAAAAVDDLPGDATGWETPHPVESGPPPAERVYQHRVPPLRGGLNVHNGEMAAHGGRH